MKARQLRTLLGNASVSNVVARHGAAEMFD
ncbi:hypothetical protein EC9_54710 [Rosistilla ulvae]|uniref:Uncharacterized protein n=1 Tax=Rosistilla ulvae TaxID=1930277 RepID=A0A517M8X2_9BACT|nr:hypothetical protein EC9_54710 [Rosistilla ulvae]